MGTVSMLLKTEATVFVLLRGRSMQMDWIRSLLCRIGGSAACVRRTCGLADLNGMQWN